jgi:hypothetical protein
VVTMKSTILLGYKALWSVERQVKFSRNVSSPSWPNKSSKMPLRKQIAMYYEGSMEIGCILFSVLHDRIPAMKIDGKMRRTLCASVTTA